jgi:hypothetical protein
MKTLLALALTGCGLSLGGEDLPQVDSGPQITAVQESAARDAQAELTYEAGKPEAAAEHDAGTIEAAPEASSAPEASDDAAPEATTFIEAGVVDAAVPTDIITFCLGCLDDRGICFAGNMTTACGKNGQKCMDCTTAGLQHVCGIPNYVCL